MSAETIFKFGEAVLVDPKALNGSPGVRGWVHDITDNPTRLYQVRFKGGHMAWFKPHEIHPLPLAMMGWEDL